MSQNSKPGKYYVKLVRMVVQAADFEVDAADEEEAVRKAAEEAVETGDEKWTGKFDPDEYSYDIQVLLGPDELADEDIGRPTIGTGPEDDVRYALLKADINAGEGQFCPQSWMFRESDLLLSDVCGDWARDVSELGEGHDERYWSSFTELAARPLAAVVSYAEFLRRRNRGKLGDTEAPPKDD